jgi:tetratricopeptide (TPR) repeat protein
MKRVVKRKLFGVFVLAVAGIASAQDDQPLAPLLEGLGDYHYPITANARAQKFFDQGLMLSFAFNHGEAKRSYQEAARLDPECAMAHWGIALVLGPNINAGMEDDDVPEAYASAQKALELASGASEKEQALIAALTKRYGPEPVEDRASFNEAYAEAMRAVAKQYPEDVTVLSLAAEALMDLHPWDYWTHEGAIQPWTQEILDLLESALKLDEQHAGANHLYIHAVEASDRPEIGLPSADRLGSIAPGAGHLVHMPAHIYIRVGRYRDASLANVRAMASDSEYITQCHAQGVYPLAYMPHNAHFLWATATMEGDSKTAMDAAQKTADMVADDMMREPGMGTLQHYKMIPLYAMVRFGKWDQILSFPEPAQDLLYPRGVWHYARGIAFARTGKTKDAVDELAALKTIAADPAVAEITIWDINTTSDLLKIAFNVLAGEIAAAKGEYEHAIAQLNEAVDIEDALTYNEPPDWFFPVRQTYGAVLLESGDPQSAESVYRADLKKFPNNGWSLFGLAQALRDQGKTEEAAKVDEQFKTAWAHGDVEINGSRF